MSFKSEETKKITVAMVLEAIGRPPEHITQTLEDLVKKIGEEKGVKILDKRVNEPVLMKDQKDFYTNFVDVDLEVDNILILTGLILKYMPAHVEIIEPELVVLSNNRWNEMFSELTRKLHGYDEIARILQVEKGILEKKLREVIGEKK